MNGLLRHFNFRNIGPAVLNGGLSTFLAFVLLAFSNSYVFLTFFKVLLTVFWTKVLKNVSNQFQMLEYTDRVTRIEPLECYARGSILLTQSVLK